MSDDNMSPSSVAKKLNTVDRKYHRDIETARREGHKEGLAKGRQEIIDFLQTAYLKPGAPDRGTPEALAILKIAADASEHFVRRQKNPRR